MGFKILVTGGAGYIGSTLVPELLQAGHEVTVVDNFLFGQNSLAQLCHMQKFNIVNGDIRDERLMAAQIKDADIVIPLAALVGAPLCSKDPVGATTVNRQANLWLFKNLSPSQWVLMPTTNSAYGTGDGDKECTEESPLKPISLYAREKVEIEHELMQRKNAISFRLATVFGMSPRMRLDLLVNDFTYRAVTDRAVVLFEAHFKRNYVHVRDVMRVFMYGIDNFEKMSGNIFNVGLADANLSKLELCHAIKKHIPNLAITQADVGQDPDQRNYIVSNRKLDQTGFRMAHSLDHGLKELIKGFQMIRNSKYSNV